MYYSCIATKRKNHVKSLNLSNMLQLLALLLVLSGVGIGTAQTPDTAAELMKRGLLLKEKGDNDRALDAFNRALELKPSDAALYNVRGLCRRSKGDYDGAINDFDKAIALYPTFAEAFNNRGVVKLSKKDYAGAIADFAKDIELSPTNVGG
jgi:tetratricopeptide (TPR) repeat protein